MTQTVLSPELLAQIHQRAATHDREASFPHQDLAELQEAGYLKAFVPTELGGLGLGLADVVQTQIALAKAAPATALSVNMHLVVTGIAHQLAARGDDALAFVLSDAAAGEVFAFGNSEAGNDLVMFDSLTRAETAADGSVTYTGTKIFTSLSPAWTRLAVFGRDDADPANPQLVHAIISRQTSGITVKDDWDVLGMRATQSCTTVLDGVRAEADRVYRRLPVGPSADPFIFSLFANFLVLIAAVYTGIGERAIELAVEAAHKKTSRKAGGRSYAQDPDIRWRVAEAALWQDGLVPQLLAVAGAVDRLEAVGFPQLVGVKIRATETVRDVVDQAIRVVGGSSYYNKSELGRLYRDVLAGIFHPSDAESAHSTFANALLGPIDD